MLDKIKKAKIIAVDTETTGLNVRKASCLGLGIAISEDEGYFFDSVKDIKEILEIIKDKKLIFWNAYFDLEIIRYNYGVDLWESLHADGVLLKHTVDEEQPFGLKDIAAKLYGLSAKEEQEEVKASIKANGGGLNEFAFCDKDILAKYCIKDCKLTYRLYNHYNKKVFSEGLTNFFYKEEVMPLYKYVTRHMMARGMPVNVKLLRSMQLEIMDDMNNLRTNILEAIEPHLGKFYTWFFNKENPVSSIGVHQELISMAGLNVKRTAHGKYSLARGELLKHNHPYIDFILGKGGLSPHILNEAQIRAFKGTETFNIASKHHLKKLFFDELNEEPLSRTDKGNPQVDDEFIEKMSSKYEWCVWLSQWNKLNKLKGSYIDRFLDSHEDGIFYPQYHQHRTVSGRYAGDFQQLPRADKEKDDIVWKYRNKIRDVFISANNWSYIGADYESLEPHIFAHVSGDKKLQDIFNNGHDFHSTIAIATEGIEGVSAIKKSDNYLGKLYPNLRQKAKTYSLGIPYGMEGYKLSKELNISQEEADRLVTKYLDSYLSLKQWMLESEQNVINHGFIKSQPGRTRHLNQVRGLYWKYGKTILDPLEVWKEYHMDEKKYDQMKWVRRQIKNGLNNAKNFQIQSFGASIVNRATIAINKMIKDLGSDGYVCGQVHDEIIIHCEDKFAEEVAIKMKEIMENIYKLTVKLKAPVNIGKCYGELK